MTRTLAKLQFTLWKRTVRSNPTALVMVVLIVVYALSGLLSLTAFGAIAIADGHLSAIATIVGVGTAAYVLVGLMLPTGEGQLTPESFAVYPLRARQLAPGFVLTSLLQTRGLMALLCTVVTAAMLIGMLYKVSIAAVIVVIPALILQFFITLMLGLCLLTVLGGTSSRASKERNIIISTFVLLFSYFGYLGLTMSGGDPPASLGMLGRYMMWTPLGAGGGIISSVAAGSWLAALGCATIAAATLIVATWFWLRSVNDQLEAPLDSRQRSTKTKPKVNTVGHIPLLVRPLKYGTGSMIYSRALRYVRRDSRILNAMIIFPIFAAYFLYQSHNGQPHMLYVGGCVVVIMTITAAVNDYGYDGPSNWLHISAGIPGRVLVPARHFGSVTLGYLLSALYLVVMNIVADDHILAALFTPCILGLAMSSGAINVWLSTHNAFPVARPGTNPWQDKSGFSGAALLATIATFFVGWVPSAPGFVLVLYGYFSDKPIIATVGVVLALVVPGLVYVAGMRISIAKVDRSYPEIFAKVRSYTN